MHHRQPETKEKRSILVGEASWKRYIHSGMCCCQPYTRERTSHAPQTSGKRKSENERGLSHEVPPPTQRPVLKCLGRTVRPYSTVSFLTLEEPATGTRASEEGACPMKSHLRHNARYPSVLGEPFDHAPLLVCHWDGARARRGFVPRSLTSDTAHGTRVYCENRSTMLHCLFRRACHWDGARATRGCLTRSHLRHSASLGGNAPVMLHSLSRRAYHWDGVRARSYLTSSHLQQPPGTRVSWAAMLQENDFEIRSRTRMRDRERGGEEGLG